MERADEKVLSALASLHGNPEWKVVRQWFTDSLNDEVNTLLQTKDEVSARWLQGSCSTLKTILDVSDKAMGIIHRHRTE